MRRAGETLAALAAGVALALAFPEPDLSPLAWIAIAPLLVLASDAGPRRAFFLGLVFGIGFFGVTDFWVSLFGYVAWVFAILIEGAFIGLFALGCSLLRRLPVAARVAGIVAFWVSVELLRGMVPAGGFPWGHLAQSQHSYPWMLAAAGIGGGALVSAICVGANALVAEAWASARARRTRVAAGTVLAAVVLVAAPALLPRSDPGGDPVRIAVVQGNVPREFTGNVFEKDLVILDNHRRLTEGLVGEDPDLVVWPESAVGIDLERDARVGRIVSEAARDIGVPLLIGGNTDLDPETYRVMAFLMSPAGDIVDRYQKTHLVPFGEYIPGRRFLEWIPMLDQIERDAQAGDEGRVFDVAGGTVAPVISFEGDFGPLVQRRIDLGGRLLVVATNTSSFEELWTSAQHVAFSKVRAAENGVWVVHAALSGISAFISPEGRVVESLPLWTKGTMVRDIAFVDDVTFYARTGDWFTLLCAIVSLVLLTVALVRRQRVR